MKHLCFVATVKHLCFVERKPKVHSFGNLFLKLSHLYLYLKFHLDVAKMIYERKQKWIIICDRCCIFLYRYHHLKHSMTKTGSTSGAIEIILTDNYQILGTVLRAGEGGGWWWRGESFQPNYRTEKVRFFIKQTKRFCTPSQQL
jgi:hypothetical protein